jgi:hypothetical protein
MFFSSPDVFSPSTTGGRQFARPIFPHGEVSGEASNEPAKSADPLLRKVPCGEDCVSGYFELKSMYHVGPGSASKVFAPAGGFVFIYTAGTGIMGDRCETEAVPWISRLFGKTVS